MTGDELRRDSAIHRQQRAGSANANMTIERRPYLSLDRLPLAACLALGISIFMASWYRHATYRSQTFDLAVFDQALWLMAHGKAPIATVIGRNVFTDHFSPVLVLFVPLYLIASTPIWLFLAQAIAIAVGFLALGPLLVELGVEHRWRIAFSIAYVASTLLWQAALYDFHASTLAVPLILIGLTASLRDRPRALAISALALLLIRDDLGLVVVSLALIQFTRSRWRTLRVSLIGVALITVVVGQAIGVVAGSRHLWLIYYGHLGPDGRWVLTHPWVSVPRAVGALWRRDVLRDILGWLLPFSFLPLLRPGRLLLGILWGIPLLVASPLLGPGGLYLFHFGAVLFPFFVWAAAEASTALPAWLRTRGPVILVSVSLATFVALSPFKTWIADRPAHPIGVDSEAVRLIGAHEAVTASLSLGAHLAHRVTLLPFPYPFASLGSVRTISERVTVVSRTAAATIDVVALDVRDSSPAIVQAFFESPYLRGYSEVFQRYGLYVFRRICGGTPSS
jgi:uncharacterized membrane protein